MRRQVGRDDVLKRNDTESSLGRQIIVPIGGCRRLLKPMGIYDYDWLVDRCTKEQRAFYGERKLAKTRRASYHGVNPVRPYMCNCARNFNRIVDLRHHQKTCRMRGLTPSRETLGDTYRVWMAAMGGPWKLAWAIAVRFIAILRARRKERKAYAPGGPGMLECVRLWSEMHETRAHEVDLATATPNVAPSAS